MTEKLIPASKLEELQEYWVSSFNGRMYLATSKEGVKPRYVLANDIRALIEDEPEVSDEPVGDWLWGKLMDWCKTRRVAPANHNDLFAIVGLAREKFGAAAIKTPPSQDQTALIRDLKKALENMRELITNDYKTEEYLDDLLFQAEKAIK